MGIKYFCDVCNRDIPNERFYEISGELTSRGVYNTNPIYGPKRVEFKIYLCVNCTKRYMGEMSRTTGEANLRMIALLKDIGKVGGTEGCVEDEDYTD